MLGDTIYTLLCKSKNQTTQVKNHFFSGDMVMAASFLQSIMTALHCGLSISPRRVVGCGEKGKQQNYKQRGIHDIKESSLQQTHMIAGENILLLYQSMPMKLFGQFCASSKDLYSLDTIKSYHS
jgi:hypothetical protein